MIKNNIIKVLIIDDEEPARNLIKVFLKQFDNILILDEASDGFSAIKKINELNPDLIFLDIQMPKLTGFEMLELIENPPYIIFTTAYDQYAVKAFEFNAIDYLLKPFNRERFKLAIEKAAEKINSGEKNPEDIGKLIKYGQENVDLIHRVAVKKKSKIFIIPVEDIYCFEAQDDYVMIYTQNDNFLKETTMKFFESHLDSEIFVRVHRSNIVNIKHIDKIELFEKDSYYIFLKNQQKVKSSKTGYKLLKSKLNL